MAHLYKPIQVDSAYARKNWHGTVEEYQHALDTSTTVYVGNLSFYTREEQIFELFSKVGEVKRIVMGLNKYELTPCGFCFVEYYTHDAAADCVNYVSGTKLDERVIRADWDTGFVEGRQYGRGSSGGQVRDDYRDYYDPERGDRRSKGKSESEHTPSRNGGGFGGSGSSSGGTSHKGSSSHHEPRSSSPSRGGRSPSPHRRSPSHDRHSSYDNRHDSGRKGDDRHGSSSRRSDRYDDYHRESHRDRDYHDEASSRHKRSRDDYERRHTMEPMVDEFGRDIPASKKPKLSDDRH